MPFIANHPSIEAIGEFKISKNNQSSDFGLASGMISFTFRSGANDLHGRVFNFLQYDHLNALDFATKARGGAKAPLKQNEYGFTAGGPVWIPKAYKGRDRTFFFTSYTGFQYRPSANNPNLTTFPRPLSAGRLFAVAGPAGDRGRARQSRPRTARRIRAYTSTFSISQASQKHTRAVWFA